MKKLLWALLIVPALVSGEIKFTLKGKLGKHDAPAKLYLVYKKNNNDVIQEIPLKKGIFEYKGSAPDIDLAMLCLDREGKQNVRGNADAKLFYLEAGNINFLGVDSIASANITEGSLNIDFDAFKKKAAPAQERMSAFMQEFQSKASEVQKNPTLMQEYQERYRTIFTEVRINEYEFIMTHLQSYLSLKFIQGWMGTPDYNGEAILEVFNKLSPELKNSALGKQTEATLKASMGTNIGSIAMDFEQNNTEGVPTKLSSTRGKYVLLDFWASWCGPCRGENPNVVANYQKYKDKGFTVFGVSLDNSKSNWIKAISDDNLTWTHVSDLKGWQNEVAQRYRVQSIPQNFLLDPDGRIIGKNLRGAELEAKLKEIFGM